MILLEGKNKGRGNYKWAVLAMWSDDSWFTPANPEELFFRYVLRIRLVPFEGIAFTEKVT